MPGVKAALARIWPIDLVTQVAAEARTALRHFQSWWSNRSAFRGRSDLRLNVGCGNNVISDWINIDLAKRPGVLYWDCRRSLPFDDASVAVIFAEHVFEHFDHDASSRFLSECRRCLEPGGVLRIVVPDAGMYLDHYRGDWSHIVAARPLIAENGR